MDPLTGQSVRRDALAGSIALQLCHLLVHIQTQPVFENRHVFVT